MRLVTVHSEGLSISAGTEQIERNEEQPSGVVSGASVTVGNWMDASGHLPSLHKITQKQATGSWNKNC